MIRSRLARALIATANAMYRAAERMNPCPASVLTSVRATDVQAICNVEFVGLAAGPRIVRLGGEVAGRPRTPFTRKRARAKA